MTRIMLFIGTNIAVMLVFGVISYIFGLDQYLTPYGINYTSLMMFSLVFGFTGAIISLLLSKTMAKWSMGLTMINDPSNETERWIVQTVKKLSDTASIGMPEVGVYEGAPNAFATGAFKNSALVAVSTGLLETMDREEVEAVLAHEVSHIVNGDMVTMTLIQGVVNTFVIFLSRALGFIIDSFLHRGEERRGSFGVGYFVTRMVLEIFFGFLASMIVAWFSRKREFRADGGAAKLMGRRQPMISALKRLGGVDAGKLPKGLQAMGISSSSIGRLFATHPPIEDRIKYLQQQQSFE